MEGPCAIWCANAFSTACARFSDKWLDVSKRCARRAEALQCRGVRHSARSCGSRLATGNFDALTLIHNDLHRRDDPIHEIAALKKNFPT